MSNSSRSFAWTFLVLMATANCNSAFRTTLTIGRNIRIGLSQLNMSTKSEDSMSFGPFQIAKEHVFYESSLTAAFVNLRPLVPGHVLVVPKRVVPHLSDLTSEEHAALWESVRVVQNVMGRYYSEAQAFNVAVQDGKAAGQSVPHVHVHILPRIPGDYQRNDQIYDDIQEWAPRDELKQKIKLEVPEDEDRKDRTVEQMSQEAAKYRNLIP